MLGCIVAPVVGEPFNVSAVNFAEENDRWGLGARGLVRPHNPAVEAQMIGRLTTISRQWSGADLTQYPEGQRQIYEAIEEVKRFAPPGMAGYKQLMHVKEFAEQWSDKRVYMVRNPLGVLAGHLDIVRGAGTTESWPIWLARNVKQFHPEAWAALLGPNTLEANLARAFKIRSENDWQSLQPMGAKFIRFEDLIVNFDVGWGGLLDYLELEPTDKFLEALHKTRTIPSTHHDGRVKQLRPERDLVEAINAIFSGGWNVGHGSA